MVIVYRKILSQKK